MWFGLELLGGVVDGWSRMKWKAPFCSFIFPSFADSCRIWILAWKFSVGDSGQPCLLEVPSEYLGERHRVTPPAHVRLVWHASNTDRTWQSDQLICWKRELKCGESDVGFRSLDGSTVDKNGDMYIVHDFGNKYLEDKCRRWICISTRSHRVVMSFHCHLECGNARSWKTLVDPWLAALLAGSASLLPMYLL